MPNVNKSHSTAPLLAQNAPSPIKGKVETTGDLRRFLSYIAGAVARGEMKVAEAAVAVKACEQINASLYSEIKSAALQAEAGKEVPKLGAMRIIDSD